LYERLVRILIDGQIVADPERAESSGAARQFGDAGPGEIVRSVQAALDHGRPKRRTMFGVRVGTGRMGDQSRKRSGARTLG